MDGTGSYETQISVMKERYTSPKPKQVHPQQTEGDAWTPTVSKLLSRDVDWDREQLGDVLHWVRQGLALVAGLIWGAIPLTGAFWLVLFFALSTGAVYGYYHYVLKVDEEELGGHAALLQEGMLASVSLFLLAWTTTYSLFHF